MSEGLYSMEAKDFDKKRETGPCTDLFQISPIFLVFESVFSIVRLYHVCRFV